MSKRLLAMLLSALVVTASSVVVYAEDDIVVDADQVEVAEEVELDEAIADEVIIEDSIVEEESSADGVEVIEVIDDIQAEDSAVDPRGYLGNVEYSLTTLPNGNYKLSLTAEGSYTSLFVDVSDYFEEEADKIEEIYIEKNISDLEKGVFSNLTGLKKVTAGDYYYEQVDSNCKMSLDTHVFAGCTNLESVDLPVQSIAMGAFDNCRKLKSFTSKIVTYRSSRSIMVNAYAFNGCESLEKITLLAGRINIVPGAFEGCNRNVVLSSACESAHNAADEAGIRYESYTGSDFAPAVLDSNHKVKAVSADNPELDLTDYLRYHVLAKTESGKSVGDFAKKLVSEDESIVTTKDDSKICFVSPGLAKVKVIIVDYPDVSMDIIVNAYEPVDKVAITTIGTKVSPGSTATIKASVEQVNVDTREIAWQVYEKKNGKLQKTPLTTASGIYVETVSVENGITTGKLTVEKNPKNEKGEKVSDFVVKAVSVANYNDGKTEKTESNDYVYASSEYVTGRVNYNIAFDGNGASSGSTKKMSACKYGTKYALSNNGFKRKGYTFVGWNTKKNGKGVSYKNKEKVYNLCSENGKTITLYAQWELNKYNIKFEGNGATSGKMKMMEGVGYGKAVKLSANKFAKKGYTFVGWNTKKNGTGKMYRNKQSVKSLSEKNGATVKLYAIWKKK